MQCVLAIKGLEPDLISIAQDKFLHPCSLIRNANLLYSSDQKRVYLLIILYNFANYSEAMLYLPICTVCLSQDPLPSDVSAYLYSL